MHSLTKLGKIRAATKNRVNINGAETSRLFLCAALSKIFAHASGDMTGISDAIPGSLSCESGFASK